MTPEERSKLIADWIEHHTTRIERDADNVFHRITGEDKFWAWERLDEICRDDPNLCLELIVQILHTPHHESVKWSLAAGPLEDLLARHGAEVIARVEVLAGCDPEFRKLLGGVWPNVTSADVWKRVEAVRG